MTSNTANDLDHIPRGSTAQNRLRQYYQYARSSSRSKEDALRTAIDRVRTDYPEFEPEFDRSYFSMDRDADTRDQSGPVSDSKGEDAVVSPNSESVLISLCACGVPCRYHGQTHKMGHRLIKEKKVAELKSKYNVIPVCPEIMGGLPTPRCPCHVTWDGDEPTVTNRKTGEREFQGTDLTAAYKRGAEWTLWMAKLFNCQKAYMLKLSPACDPKEGVAGRLLARNGVRVVEL